MTYKKSICFRHNMSYNMCFSLDFIVCCNDMETRDFYLRSSPTPMTIVMRVKQILSRSWSLNTYEN